MTEKSMVLQLVNYKEILAVINVASIAYFWKGHSARGSDLSQRQNWTVAHVAILFTLLDLAVASFYFLPYFFGSSAFLPYGYTSYLGLVVGLNIIGLGCFFSYVGQPLSTVGFSRESWGFLGPAELANSFNRDFHYLCRDGIVYVSCAVVL